MASNYSNDPLETINHKIKQIKRTAYDYLVAFLHQN
ncbi:transposase [Liquorilactobacillus nagelii]|nr:transposase [Liquorilactobacillus nagelii]ULQ49650.1 transposase [Liquorilactobacillus nagelii]